MKKLGFNPYLPSWEYIPDGEPYVFGDRVYVYGSHDRLNAPIFCVNDYVCWSAPVDDLSDWRYEGVIYKKNQDPKNKLGLRRPGSLWTEKPWPGGVNCGSCSRCRRNTDR